MISIVLSPRLRGPRPHARRRDRLLALVLAAREEGIHARELVGVLVQQEAHERPGRDVVVVGKGDRFEDDEACYYYAQLAVAYVQVAMIYPVWLAQRRQDDAAELTVDSFLQTVHRLGRFSSVLRLPVLSESASFWFLFDLFFLSPRIVKRFVFQNRTKGRKREKT